MGKSPKQTFNLLMKDKSDPELLIPEVSTLNLSIPVYFKPYTCFTGKNFSTQSATLTDIIDPLVISIFNLFLFPFFVSRSSLFSTTERLNSGDSTRSSPSFMVLAGASARGPSWPLHVAAGGTGGPYAAALIPPCPASISDPHGLHPHGLATCSRMGSICSESMELHARKLGLGT